MGADDVPSADGRYPASPDDERASLTASVHSVHCSSRGATSADAAHALDADDVVVGVTGDGEGDDAKQEYDRKIAEVMSDAGCSSSEGEEEDDSPASIQPVIPTELPVGPAGVTSPEFAHVVANASGVEWKGIALAAGLASFEGDWQPQLPHAKEDAALVSETCHSLGFNSVVDLTNNKVYNTQRIGSHRCGQLSYWELQTHFRNAAQIAGDGVLLFYMSTRAGYSSAAMKKSGGPPDALCTYDSDSLIKLDDFVKKIASLVTPNVTTIVVLDLSVPQQYDMTRLPNLAALCPPRFSVMVSLTPIEAPIFTPKFLQAITQPPPPGSESGGMTLKDVAWSEHISSELSRVAEACCRAEEERGVSQAARRWTLPQWIPNTAACSLDDSSMNTTIGNPVAVGLVHISDDTKLLVSLTKRITTTPDNLVKMFEKLRVIESLLGPGSGDAIVSMQPLQGVVVSQASSTHHKAWEAFRSLHSLSTAEMQKCDKDKETAGSNKMVTYFKLGDVYTPNSRAEHEWFSLERNYTSITGRGGDLFFGSDPQAGLAIDALSTEQACKISGLSLRVEPTFKASVASHVKLVAESRMPPSSTSLLGGEGGVFEMKVHKIYQLLNPKTTSVRYFADTEYQRRQQLRTKVACKMDLTRAIGANQNGMVEPDAANRGFSQWLQVSQDAQIEAAIRIQSIFRMYCVRKMVLQLQWQMGDRDSPRDGIEIRRAVRQWLLACSRHCEWRPLSSSITCFVSSGLPPRGAGAVYSYDQLMAWMAKYNRLRADLVGHIARELNLDRTVMGGVNLIRVEGVSGGPPSHQFVVKLRAVAEEASDGMHVSAEARQALEDMAERIANVMRFQLKDTFGVTEVVVQSEKTVRGMEHVDVRNATCEQAIRSVLSGKADGDRSKDAALPPSIRRTLESGLDEGRSATDHIIYALLADDECSVPMGWKRHVLEAPLLPGNAFCVKPREGTPLFEALKMTDEQKARSKEFMDLKFVHDIFSIARLRGDKKLVYEAPGVRQLEKTPLIVYSRYWADKGYYDEVQEYSAFAEAERLKLMMHTVRNRRELKMMYKVSLFRGLKDLLFEVTRGCCLKFSWMLSVMAVGLYSILIYLLPQWCANILSLFYLSDMSQLSLEAIITWLLIFLLLLLGGLFLGGACVSYVKGNFSYKVWREEEHPDNTQSFPHVHTHTQVRTLFIYISAKYSRLLSAELVYNIREKGMFRHPHPSSPHPLCSTPHRHPPCRHTPVQHDAAPGDELHPRHDFDHHPVRDLRADRPDLPDLPGAEGPAARGVRQVHDAAHDRHRQHREGGAAALGCAARPAGRRRARRGAGCRRPPDAAVPLCPRETSGQHEQHDGAHPDRRRGLADDVLAARLPPLRRRQPGGGVPERRAADGEAGGAAAACVLLLRAAAGLVAHGPAGYGAACGVPPQHPAAADGAALREADGGGGGRHEEAALAGPRRHRVGRTSPRHLRRWPHGACARARLGQRRGGGGDGGRPALCGG